MCIPRKRDWLISRWKSAGMEESKKPRILYGNYPERVRTSWRQGLREWLLGLKEFRGGDQIRLPSELVRQMFNWVGQLAVFKYDVCTFTETCNIKTGNIISIGHLYWGSVCKASSWPQLNPTTKCANLSIACALPPRSVVPKYNSWISVQSGPYRNRILISGRSRKG